MEKRPFFSVITASYNSAERLPRCIESVADQAFPRVEHLVIDGGSADGTLEVLRRNEHRLARWLSEPDEGIYDAWNKGVELARGEWILFLGADDRLADEKVLGDVSRKIEQAGAGPPFVYGRVTVVDPDSGREVARHGRPWEEMEGTYKGLKPAAPSNAGTFHHRSLFEEGARFDTRYRIAADYKFVLQLLRKTGAEPFWVDRLVAVMDGGGASSRPGLRKYREEVRMLRELGERPPTSRRLYMGMRAYVTTFLHRLLGHRNYERLAHAWRSITNRNRTAKEES